MKNYSLFSYEFLFSDHFAHVSCEAKLLYIEMNFFANNGFVSNPRGIIDSHGYPCDSLQELINNGDILAIPDREEVFITAYFCHNKVNPLSWKNTPFYYYWKDRLFIKQNGIATFKKPDESFQYSAPNRDAIVPASVSSQIDNAEAMRQRLIRDAKSINNHDDPDDEFDVLRDNMGIV